MGEYAKYCGESVKIGTCEDMYYLRHDQRFQVQRESNSVDPVADAAAIRFRFPWPDEDHISPGSSEFHDKGYHRSIPVYGFDAPASVEHGSVQFVARAGYNVCLPCPESSAYSGVSGLGPLLLVRGPDPAIQVHRNGFSGAVHLVSQKYVPGIGLVPILKCGGCGDMWREEDIARIEQLAVCIRSEGDKRAKRNESGAEFFQQIADRVLAGLELGSVTVTGK